MAVSIMKKLSLFALSSEAEALIARLTWLSCVELTKTEPEDGWLRAEENSRFGAVKGQRDRIEEALSILKPYEVAKKGLFTTRPEIQKSDFEPIEGELEQALSDAHKIIDAKDRLLAARAEKAKASAREAAYAPYMSYDLPLSYPGTKDSRVILGTFPLSAEIDVMKAALFEQTDRVVVEKISADTTAAYYSIICYAADLDAVLRVLGSHGFARADFTGTAGTAYEAAQRAVQAGKEADRLAEEAQNTLGELARHQDSLQRAADLLAVEMTKAQAGEKLLHSERTVYMTGWVPAQAEKKVRRALEKFCCAYELTEPAPGDEPPVLLQNNKWAKPFEFVIKLYSLPQYGTFDPTFIMSLFYFLIFGMMLADVVYGLLLVVFGLLIYKVLDVGEGVKSLSLMFAYCGISCMLFGFLFGGYFGDLPVKILQSMLGDSSVTSLAVWFDPVTGSGPIYFIAVSLGAGVLHLLCGMGVKAVLLIKEGKVFDAIFDIGSWYVLFAGIGLLFAVPTAGGIVAAVGVLMLVLTQGRGEKNPVMKLLKGVLSLYDIVNYVADLLSYTRIMALGLASAIVASVVNTLATLNGNSVLGWILMTVIVLFGHTINIAINLLGSFVHTSRLQYIEFFGKFYEDGGREFKPVVPETQYTKIVGTAEDEANGQ